MNLFILHLSLIKGIGPVTISQLVERLESNNLIESSYQLQVKDLQFLGFSFATADLIIKGLQDYTLCDAEIKLYEKHAIQWMTYKDSEYPEMLKNIYAPPAIISWRGDMNYEQALAVVGSRDATEYGREAVEFFVPRLVEQGYAVVSGGAYGIDAFAHESAIRAGGKTIVVLGSGLVKPYPREHIRLFDKVVESGGAILSIFPIMASAAPGNFPARNRVIAGLSHGCIVVQAALKSGAKITAEFALQQGRSVFAIPGLFNHPLSEGCNDLIKQGATMLTSFDDIAQEFGITQYRKPIIQEEKTYFSDSEKSIVLPPKKHLQENKIHDNPILSFCRIPQSFDDLIKEFPEKNPTELQDILFDLSLEGLIEQDFSGMWNSAIK